MSDVTLYGFPPSSYVRTILMVCEAKAIQYTLEPVDFSSVEYRAKHPFNRIPAMRHEDLTLFETHAIATYLDEIFDGPALQPDAIADRAQMTQWISAINDYVYSSIVGGVISERVIKAMRGAPADEDRIKAALPKVQHSIAALEAAVAPTGYLVGRQITLADLFLAPILNYFDGTSEGCTMMPDYPALQDWLSRMKAEAIGFERVNAPLSLPEPAEPV